MEETANVDIVKSLLVEMSRDIASLQDDVSDKDHVNSDLISELNDMEKVMEQLRFKLTTSEATCDVLRKDNENLIADVQFWKDKHNASPETLNLIEANKKLLEELARNKSRMAEMQTTILSLESEVSDLNDELDEVIDLHPHDCKCGYCEDPTSGT